ncbi:hypothetical protein Bbelb_195800 [Branchiostoma belcheri]|nr:hypothetical protein Bbelb_195800 [Branchiostoma belcheri]
MEAIVSSQKTPLPRTSPRVSEYCFLLQPSGGDPRQSLHFQTTAFILTGSVSDGGAAEKNQRCAPDSTREPVACFLNTRKHQGQWPGPSHALAAEGEVLTPRLTPGVPPGYLPLMRPDSLVEARPSESPKRNRRGNKRSSAE